METPDGNRPRLTSLGDRHLGAARRQARRQRVRVAGRPESLSVVLQPVVALYTEVPIGFEALARFRCAPGRGPAWWFAEAEAVGLRTDLELAAVRAALRTLDHLPEGTWLAVNASPSTMTSPGFADVISASTPDRLVLELTEHAFVHEYGALATAVAPLRHRGIRLAIDDAGAGFATFTHILELSPDIIKLDVTLTRRIHEAPSRRALVSALVSFARDVDAQLIGEGIETEPELVTLRELGVRFGQGNYLGRPESAVAATRSVTRRSTGRTPRGADAAAPGRVRASA